MDKRELVEKTKELIRDSKTFNMFDFYHCLAHYVVVASGASLRDGSDYTEDGDHVQDVAQVLLSLPSADMFHVERWPQELEADYDSGDCRESAISAIDHFMKDSQ